MCIRDRPRTHARSAWTTKHGRDPSAPAIATLSCIICQQVKSRRNEIDELKLGNGFHPHQSCAACRTDYRAFGDRSVNNSLLAVLVDKAIGNFESSTISANIFANDKDCWVTFHLFPDTLANRFHQRRRSTTFWTSRFMFFFNSGRHRLGLQNLWPEGRFHNFVIENSEGSSLTIRQGR